MVKIDEKIERFEKYKEENINLEMLLKDKSRVQFSPQMGTNEWQPTKTTEKAFMTATIMSSEKRKSPIQKPKEITKDKNKDKSKSPVGSQKSTIDNRTDRQKAKEAT